MIIFNIQKEVFILSQNIIEIKNVSKTYGDNTVLNNLSLNIRKNEFLTLLGPSGCGKTTTLKILAGFEKYYLEELKALHEAGKLEYHGSAEKLKNQYSFKELLNTLYSKEWIVYTKKAFNGADR